MKRTAPPLPTGPGYLMYEEAAAYDRMQFILLGGDHCSHCGAAIICCSLTLM